MIDAWFRKHEPYVHPLARERMELANHLDTLEFMGRCDYLEELSRDNFELYASWMQECYPGPGDKT